MNKKNGASPRSEVGGRFQYFEAAVVVAPTSSSIRKWETETSSMTIGSAASRSSLRGGRSPRSVSRTVSSNSLLRPSRGPGLDPSALFSVAAMATAPVGGTVIEDEEVDDSILDAEAIEWMEMKATLSTAEDDDLCEHCSRKRQERRRLRQIKKASQEVLVSTTTKESAAAGSCSSNTNAAAANAEDRTGLNSESSSTSLTYRRPLSESDTVVDRLTQDPSSSSSKVKKDAQNFRNVMSTTASYSNKPTVANSASAASLTIECRTNQPVKVPPPRPPRSKKVPSSSSKKSCRSESDNLRGGGGHPPRGRSKHQQQQHQKAEATSSSGSGTTTLAGCGTPGEAFTITTNPINSEAEEDEELSDFCPPSEDALGLSPQELARLQKRLKLRRILPSCITFEDLEDDRTSGDHEAITRLELVDSDLADTHRGVLSRTHNKYLVMEAATFSDKLFTGTLIFCTVVGIFVLFWFQNFGPGFGLTHVSTL